MILTIREDIAIKYTLNMHLMESFIERDSIAFELIKYTMGQIESGKKDMIFENFKFTSKTLKYIFGDKMKDDKFKQFIVTSIKEMLAENMIVVNEKAKAMFLTEKMITNFYKIT